MKTIRGLICLGLILSLALAAGCSWFQQSNESTQQAAGKPPAEKAVARYYDFDDILIPLDLDLNKDKSILFKVGTFKAGVLVLSGRVESESLINFFVESMAKDNWQLKSSFKYPQVALFFAKKGKTCVINIKEGTLDTDVAIWVAPTD